MSEIWVLAVPRHMSVQDAVIEIETFGELVGYRWWKPRFWWPRWTCVRVTRTHAGLVVDPIKE